VTRLRDDEVHVQFDDGDRAWVRFEHLLPLELAVGMFVMGRFRMGPNFYPGTLSEIDGERIHIRYDDGDEEWTTAAALALPLQPPPGAPAAPAPAAPAPAMPAHAARLSGGGNTSPLVWIMGGIIVVLALVVLWLALRLH
jgi:hypothetical protein